jgi:hypothetical protein
LDGKTLAEEIGDPEDVLELLWLLLSAVLTSLRTRQGLVL